MTDNPDIELTGRSFTTLETAVTDIRAGDLKLYPQDDKQGKQRRAHGHTNLGFSGKVNASIWNGEAWRRFDVWALLGPETVKFAARLDIEETIDRVRAGVETHSDSIATWDGKRYVPREAVEQADAAIAASPRR